MAAVPSALQMSSQARKRAERADDIAWLQNELQLPDLEYVDISAQLELQRALQRWPLLSELHQDAGKPLVRQAYSTEDVS